MVAVRRLTPRTVLTVAAAVLAAAAVVVAPGSSAAAGALDTGFGTGGRVVRDHAGCEDHGAALVQQPDGKLVVGGGVCTEDAYRPVLQRYTAAGAPDATFGTGGSAVPAFEGSFWTLELPGDGDVVAGGVLETSSGAEAVVARYSSTGTEEMRFSHAVGGAGTTSSVDDLVVSAGTVTASGTTCEPAGDEHDEVCRLFVMKVTGEGALDTSFDGDGVATSAPGLYGRTALLADGRVAFAGFEDGGDLFGGSVVRLFTSALAPDTTFNTTGARALDMWAYSVVPAPAGLLVVGEQWSEATGDSDVSAAMFALTGAPAPGFGVQGVAVRDLGGNEYAYSGAVDGSGNVYLATEDNDEGGTFGLARLTPAGALDSAFGEGGAVNVSFGVDQWAWAASVTVQSDGKPVMVGATQSDAGLQDVALARFQATTPHQVRYTSVAPTRILDTRPTSPVTGDGIGAALGPVGQFDMQVTGKGGVPATGVSAVVLNVTAISPTAGGFVSAFPAGSPRPGASNLNFTPGQVVPNLVTVKLGDAGKVTLFNGSSGQTHLAVDVAGWYSDGTSPVAGGSYVPVTPARIADSRAGRLPAGDGLDAAIARTGSADLTVTGKHGIPPTGVSAVVLNVTVTGPTAGGFLTVHPAGSTRPNASNLNFGAGQTVANLVVVKVGTGGKVTLFNGSGGTTHVLADVAGYFTDATSSLTGGSFQALTPSRLLDTRPGGGPPEVKLGPGQTITVKIAGRGRVPATGVSAVALNVTAVAPTAGGFLTVYPADAPSRPVVSNVNFAAGTTVPNAVIVKLGADGSVKLYNALGHTHVLFDVAGWYDAATVA